MTLEFEPFFGSSNYPDIIKSISICNLYTNYPNNLKLLFLNPSEINEYRGISSHQNSDKTFYDLVIWLEPYEKDSLGCELPRKNIMITTPHYELAKAYHQAITNNQDFYLDEFRQNNPELFV